ncbi:PTS fructose IIC component [Rhodospirillum rubrum F11]|uniref:protein-N(pi)-phosphohistidine--D-fructose phosphotransferase n=2 Tax=Rhodospirillum rubrum TaxID=1085 RepID=Q2RSX5_RHORT|nr:fructose-specific PTS transporter subunit EIIC [Rhodospirillum rubrum]ABC22770.1 PTS fructose IIC component [Rhodospirillum rubrum ATCC 11170]AEO48491.1 PTS fructose IIC component [Rhodospirillum rubrum F11]MBK5954367.1 PTS fructose transporter subunit EIIBC [Rhodospirillum rubrum]QXG78759.1 fructose-specific PTS transporter subunit EIIC [Rhodospirillum rubrum]
MSQFIAVVGGGERSTQALLVAEALRRAASGAGHRIDIEVRSDQGVVNALSDDAIVRARAVILIGTGDLDVGRFPGLPKLETTIEAVLADVGAVLGRAEGAELAGSVAATDDGVRRIVAITSCPTGIAHTFMAAEGITQAAKALGYQARVETQGSVGSRDTLSDDEIAQADIVLIAADTQIDLARFDGKRVFLSGTKPAIADGKALIARALAEATLQGGKKSLVDTVEAGKAQRSAQRTGAYKHLMTGVSFMLPFVVAGGLLIALAFALGGINAFDEANKGTLAYDLFQIGAKSAFVLMVPALAGYIAFSIADRPGIAPGMIGGLVAANLGAGFLGGIIAGFIAGYVTAWFNRTIRLHRNLEGLKPVLILPVLGTVVTGLLMIYVVGTPVAGLLSWLTEALRGMQGSSAIVLGLLIGAMMAFDMGGPVNKAAYAFSTGLLASEVYTPMAAAMVAGMTPALGVALASRLFRSRFTASEREAGGAAAVLGLAFITEGAIPFAASDPFRVIPALMAGSAAAGAISMTVGAELKVPHGGIFVLPIPNAVTHLLGYIVALVVGTLITALVLRITKRPVAVL